MTDRDETLEALKRIDDAQDIPNGVEVGEVFVEEFRTIRRALEQQREPDIKAAAQRMAEYLDGYEGDPMLYFSVPLDGDLTNCTVDGEVNLHELAQAALAALEPENDDGHD